MSASALLVGGIFAHHLAGASVPSGSHLLGFLFLAFALTLFLLDEKLSEEKLFAAIFIAQNGSHFLMGGKSENATVMFASHLLAGVATYLVIVRGRLLLDSIEYALERLTSLLTPDTYPVLAFSAEKSGEIAAADHISFRQRLRYSALSLRAPPAP
ncbi:hypothetical protein MCEMRE26_00178 [Candidatus Nanopelagicaceae bacterium]